MERVLNEKWLEERRQRRESRESFLQEQLIEGGADSRAEMQLDYTTGKKSRRWDGKTKYKKKERVWSMNTDFLDWIGGLVDKINVNDSAVRMTGRKGNFAGLEILYRQLGMEPGKKYQVQIVWSHETEQQERSTGINEVGHTWDELFYLRLHVAAGKGFWDYDFKYDDVYGENIFSSGQTPAGQKETVVVPVDFTGLDKIPGVLRIGTALMKFDDPSLSPSPDFLIHSIKVVNTATNEEVYFNDFTAGMYEAKSDTTGDTPEDHAGTWKEVDSLETK